MVLTTRSSDDSDDECVSERQRRASRERDFTFDMANFTLNEKFRLIKTIHTIEYLSIKIAGS